MSVLDVFLQAFAGPCPPAGVMGCGQPTAIWYPTLPGRGVGVHAEYGSRRPLELLPGQVLGSNNADPKWGVPGTVLSPFAWRAHAVVPPVPHDIVSVAR